MIDASLDVERDQILRLAESEISAIEAGDADSYLKLLSRNAIFMPQNDTMRTGDELRQWLRDFLDSVVVHYTRFAHGKTIVRDDLAIHTYTCGWMAIPKGVGEARLLSFKGLHVLHREEDGEWKIAVSIWNTDPAT